LEPDDAVVLGQVLWRVHAEVQVRARAHL
jgi:hypothetical protein